MSIDFACKCGKKYSVSTKLAGKITQCPKCKQTITVPVVIQDKSARIIASLEKSPDRWPPGIKDTLIEQEEKKPQAQTQSLRTGTASSAIDFTAVAENETQAVSENAPQSVEEKVWHLFTQDGKQLGPVAKSELDQWVQVGSVTAACQVFGPGQTDWQPATNFYPNLNQSQQPAAAVENGPNQSEPIQNQNEPLQNKPIPSEPAKERLLTLTAKESSGGSKPINKEMSKIKDCQLLNDKIYRVGSQLKYRKGLTASSAINPTKFKIANEAHLFHFRHPFGEFATILPFDNDAIAPIEFVARIDGRLSDAIALVACEDHNVLLDPINFNKPELKQAISELPPKQQTLWIGCNGTIPEIAVAAQKHNKLSKGLNWNGSIKSGSTTTAHTLEWGIQAFPLNDNTFLLAAQTIPKQKLLSTHYQVHWFTELCKNFGHFVQESDCQKTGSRAYVDPSIWLATADEVLAWL